MGREQKTMKKPWVVRIVEVLGWTYVALHAGVLIFAFCETYSRNGFADAAITGGVLLPQLCLPIGMVVALRKGRRSWFLWPHTVLVTLIALIYIFASVSMVWFVVSILLFLSLIAIPIALLFRPEASLWFNEKSADRKPEKYGCAVAVCAVLLFILFGVVLPDLVICGRMAKYCAMSNAMASRMRALYGVVAENNVRQANGGSWVDPNAFSNSTDFIQALGAGYGDVVQNLGRYTNIWCVVVNPPDDDMFPVLFTANMNPSDLFHEEDGHRGISLTCPKKWGGECFDFCEKAVVVTRKGGSTQIIKSKYYGGTISFPEERRAQLEATYILTPTGRVSLAVLLPHDPSQVGR